MHFVIVSVMPSPLVFVVLRFPAFFFCERWTFSGRHGTTCRNMYIWRLFWMVCCPSEILWWLFVQGIHCQLVSPMHPSLIFCSAQVALGHGFAAANFANKQHESFRPSGIFKACSCLTCQKALGGLVPLQNGASISASLPSTFYDHGKVLLVKYIVYLLLHCILGLHSLCLGNFNFCGVEFALQPTAHSSLLSATWKQPYVI